MDVQQTSALKEQREHVPVVRRLLLRIILLFLAFGMAMLLIMALRGLLPDTAAGSGSLMAGRTVSQVVGERLPATLLLLGSTLLLASFLALVATLAAIGVHRLEEMTGPLGSIVKGFGRVGVFSQAAVPVVCLALCLIYIFALRLRVVPAGMPITGARVQSLILPTLALSLLPATLTAQAVARNLTLSHRQGSDRQWASGLFMGLGVLLGQIGGLLSAMVVVEVIFAWPGIGRLAVEAAIRRDYAILSSILVAYAVIILAGRLAAVLCRWLEQRSGPPLLQPQPRPTSWRGTARRIWVVVALALLLFPLGLAIAGLAIDPDAVQQADLGAVNQPPSEDHPWGTDRLGRDMQARVLRGWLITLGALVFASLVIFVPSWLGGALTGSLASSQDSWTQSLADFLLLPADTLLFIPGVPFGIVLVLLGVGSAPPLQTWQWVGLACALVLLPRAVRMLQTLWLAAPEPHRLVVISLAGSGSLLLGTLFAGLGLVTCLDFLGFGTLPPRPSLGGILAEALVTMHSTPTGILSACIVLWLCSFAFFTAADSLAGFFHTKEALVRLNE